MKNKTVSLSAVEITHQEAPRSHALSSCLLAAVPNWDLDSPGCISCCREQSQTHSQTSAKPDFSKTLHSPECTTDDKKGDLVPSSPSKTQNFEKDLTGSQVDTGTQGDKETPGERHRGKAVPWEVAFCHHVL